MKMEFERFLIKKTEDQKDYFWDWVKDKWIEDLFPTSTSWTIFTEEITQNVYNHVLSVVPQDKEKIKIIKTNITLTEIEESKKEEKEETEN